MALLPWQARATPLSNEEYVALLSLLPLKHYRTIPKFFWLALETMRQLQRSEGLVGYSLLAEPLRRRFWTLSAWEDQQALMDFVHQAPHSKIMPSLTPHMEQTRFMQWKVTGAEIPLRWDEARARLQ